MAAVTSLAHPVAITNPEFVDAIVIPVVWSKAVASGTAANADTIDVAYLPGNAKVLFASLRVDGSLGLGATVQLRQNTSVLTGATTAGGADMEMMVSAVGRVTSGTTVDLLVGTSAITASANIEVCLGYVV